MIMNLIGDEKKLEEELNTWWKKTHAANYYSLNIYKTKMVFDF